MNHPPPDLLHRLKSHHQDHLIFGWDSLSEQQRTHLVGQLAGLDFTQLEALYAQRLSVSNDNLSANRISAVPVENREDISAETIAIGEASLRRGEIAVLLVAGGQGSRLGSEKPKGVYPVGPISGATLFEIHAAKVLALRKRFAAPVPFLVMTSPATHADTEDYFEAHNYFGLPPSDVHLFQQGTMPALDLASGKVLLERPGQLFLSPNGHGGTLTALAESGLLDTLVARGIGHIFYFQVDNALVNVCDPAFLGRHLESESEISSKVVFKTEPGEKVGVFAMCDGKCSIIEYSDLPSELATARTDTDELRFRAGNIAIHLFSTTFLKELTSGSLGLAYHLARKKVPCLDSAGTPYSPTSENALKFELFIFDAIPLAKRWSIMSVPREDEFAPLKNATGADSPESVRRLLIGRAATWLEAAGVSIPRGANHEPLFPLEISPAFALDEDECKRKIPPGTVIDSPRYFDS